ncbi:recombinase family protein [Mesorhizobium sp.]|uniref:recombinase family protein n=1 Tax=Mesorhizobium sp. TaxID=1871066 RepID=UPI000FE68576|nr:recombinase family protein [Mesorhizobium sp.]RWO54024.1 MAG: recombinase family protein [Mesorhizobium sp.]TIN22873.1 MAG: recombinase family protein [Mesorhizobium sp.]TIN37691.1 MAG: recombinase family protein [Mesorhizobium sp.]TIN48831.1 MAG: recombinase family protein [Mesorhizobium sp.]TJU73449.1 MAG: recombinase family protein [Mesorhizobium sp.]
MIIGYCRINTFEPAARLEAQKLYLARLGAENFFYEKTSIFGSTPELERAIACARRGDVIAVTKPYRVARTTREVLALIERLGTKDVGLRIVDTPIDTSTTTGRMILASAPLWTLGMSPSRSMLSDLLLFWRRRR